MAEAKKTKPAAAAAPSAEAAAVEPAAVLDPGLILESAAVRLSVRSRQAGFRRAGRAWPAEPVIVDIAEFTEAQLAQLKAEPMLIVEVAEQ